MSCLYCSWLRAENNIWCSTCCHSLIPLVKDKGFQMFYFYCPWLRADNSIWCSACCHSLILLGEGKGLLIAGFTDAFLFVFQFDPPWRRQQRWEQPWRQVQQRELACGILMRARPPPSPPMSSRLLSPSQVCLLHWYTTVWYVCVCVCVDVCVVCVEFWKYVHLKNV